jgi:short-subunit dehydrogenase
MQSMRVFITGASSGIGAALARHYAGPQAVLGLAARRLDRLDALAAALPGTVRTYGLDVSDTPALARAAADFMDRHGTPDVVIANAGISVGTSGEDPEDAATLARVLAVNVTGMAATLSAFAPAMRRAGRGRLVGIASVAGFRGLPGAGAYSSSKAAAICWLESLRVELHGSGVCVVTLCPGYIDTPMTQVNTYRMPFLLSAEAAAPRFARAIAAGRRCAVIPWQMGLVGGVLRLVPGWLYERLAARAPRKPRHLPL